MPDLFPNDIQEKPEAVSVEEQQLVSNLMKYVDLKMQPWRQDYNYKVLVECYNFRELRQWMGADMQMLALSDTPSVPIDRISRNLDVINGIRRNTGSSMKVVKREMGDDRTAEVLGDVLDWVQDTGGAKEVYDDAFDYGMLTTGIGIVKFGFDPLANGGEGEFWFEHVPIEDFGWSKCKSKTLKDISWCWHRQIMDWDDAITIAPEKAGALKGLRATIAAEWEKLKQNNVQGTFLSNDYGVATSKSEVTYSYQDQVAIFEFWKLRRIPMKKVSTMVQQPFVDSTGNSITMPDGNPLTFAVPSVKQVPFEYQNQEGEQDLANFVKEEWWQFIVATSANAGGKGILLKQQAATEPFSPFLAMQAERKKSGAPFGFIEKVAPHQKRINISWAQKVAYNNKSIKTPLVLRGVVDVDAKVTQSKIGSVMTLTNSEEIVQMNVQPQVQLQSIEEGNSARADMDFVAAASEPVMTGAAEQGSSGVKLSLQQNAVITPINKWVSAEQDFKAELGKRLLFIAIEKVPPERMLRIVGQQRFMELMQPKVDPMTGQILEAPLRLPFMPDVTEYDVTIQEKAVSDFKKQQTFNATMALKGSGVLFTDDYVIENAPIENIPEALDSNKEARNDVIAMQQQQIAMLQAALGQAQKNQRPVNQTSNAQRGRSQPQAGPQSMLGGMGPGSALSMHQQ